MLKNNKMRKLLGVFIVAISIITISCTSFTNEESQVVIVKESDIIKRTIPVKGMTCVGCEVTLEENISEIPGIVNVKASHTEKQVIVEFDSTKTSVGHIIETIKKSGYKPF